ncbi:hypothetical protein HZH68_013353 [Vespula germanica]|uniref:Uncharacterized protein n=1 Tax=Vespula germanica TaxID=30212 RepID=A0A834JIS1_VESGE|nr:hypothetical protein HZH68_013353 [Vespula germanica]
MVQTLRETLTYDPWVAAGRDRDRRSKWAMPRYGYGGIKRSASGTGEGRAVDVEYRRESPFTAEKTAAMIVYANCLRYPWV